MSFETLSSDLHLPHQNQLIHLVRQLHQESLGIPAPVNSHLNSHILLQNNLKFFPQTKNPHNTYPLHIMNSHFNQNFSLYNLMNLPNLNFQMNSFPNRNNEGIEKDFQHGINNSSIILKEKRKTKISIENNNEKSNHMLYTPLGKSMPARTFNFKLKTTKNKQTSKQHTQTKKNKIKPHKLREDTLAFELETKLANEGKFTLQLYNELKNSFCNLIKVQQISRICQLYLEQTSYSILHLIFTEITPQFSELLLDPYGNYFCLKLFYFLNTKDKISYLTSIASSFAQLATNKISTYPIQCIIEQLRSLHEQQIIFSSIKSTDYIKLALDPYGTHVLAKMLKLFDYSLIQPLSTFVLDNFLFLANNSNGLCVIKKEIIVEYKKDKFKQLQKELEENALVLIQNPYGNYALQIAIDNWELEDVESIIFEFIGKCSMLSIHKYSSNVIEKSIEKSEKFAEEFVKEVNNMEETFGLILNNNYGNYVIQASLKVVSVRNRTILIQLIEKNLLRLNDKKMINKWRNIISIYST